ncbi:MAG: glycosyltransferase family 4 protein [Opitutales bacterium]
MKVCIVTETYPPEVNGVAMTLSRLAEGLRASGHPVTVVRPRQRSETFKNHTSGDCIVRGLPLPGYDGLRFGLPCKGSLRKRWKKDPPDVIYVATEGPLGLSAIAAARALDIPVTSGFHTNFHEYMRHYKMPLLKTFVSAFLRRTHNRTRRTFAPSTQVIQRLEALGIQNLRLLGRGVDANLFHPSKRDPSLRRSWGIDPETGIAAIFVSRIAAEKNIPLALEAFARVRTHQPDAACVFVGDGPERQQLQKQHPEFIFAGMQKGEDLARHYASGDLFIFPSVTETFGNVVIEALASGLVTLAYDYAAPQQHIRHAMNGYLAAFDQPAQFLAQLDAALDARSDWHAIRTAARQTAETLDWSGVVAAFARELDQARNES